MLAVAAAGGARAACVAAPVLAGVPESYRAGPLATRFTALLAEDRYRDVPGMTERWRALIAEARTDPAAPPELPARALGWLAWSLDYLSKPEEALKAADEADRLIEAHKLHDTLFAADIWATRSVAAVDAGDLERGTRDADRALALTDRLGPESAQAGMAHNAIANVFYARGQYAQAAEEYGKAAKAAETCLPPTSAAIVNEMASHAGVLYMLGAGEEALAENERAANWAIANLDEASPVVTLALGNLGVMLRSAGRYAEAEAALRRVVDLEAKYQHDSWFYRAISLSNFASVIDRQGRHDEAEALWLRAAAWHRNVTMKRDPAQAAYPLRFSADSAQARGDLKLALARRQEAVAMIAAGAAPDHPELARARIELARTLALSARTAEGLKLADPALAVVRAKLEPDDVKRLTAEIDHARVVAAARGPAAGYALIAPIGRRLEAKLLDSATSRGDLLRYGPVFSQSFAAVTMLALATGRQEEAFRALQLANLSDIVLTTTETAARAAAGDGAAAAPLRVLQDSIRARQSLDRARTFAATAPDPKAEVARIQAAIATNDMTIARAAAELDRVFPAYRTLSRPEPRTLAAMAAGLGPSEALLAPLALDEGMITIMVTRDGLHWALTPVTRAAAAALVDRIRTSIDRARSGTARFDAGAARALYAAMLPSSLGSAVRTHPDLLYYSSGPLATIPPALLIAPARKGAPTAWLIRSHSVTVLPSLADRSNAGPHGGGEFLGIGAPLPGNTLAALAPLPFAERELRRMRTLIGSGTLLVGADARETEVKHALGRPLDVIAIATHALAGSEMPGLNEPALVLSPPGVAGANDDGLLTASEVAGLSLDANWVILSACDTATGAGAGAPAYSGLASAFTAAGARALLVSHWPVRDDAAEALTVATVTTTRKGIPRARALQRAMLAVMNDRRLPGHAHPAVWAPFVLIAR